MKKSILRKLVSGLVAGTLMSVGHGSAMAREQTLLLKQPALSKKHIAFVYAGDIWVADRDGRNARRLTSHPASESQPRFSPDGKSIAFSASYDNNMDVYVVATEGGQPRRLTWHPGADMVNGWSPDGKRIVFASRREILNGRSNQIYQISREGGPAEKLMEAHAYEGRWSGNGKRFAYRPYNMAYRGSSGWRQHRGGATPAIWIIDPDSQKVEKIPHDRVNDTNPMWLGKKVYFLSDRNDGAVNLFEYDSKGKKLRQLTKEKTWDIRSADAYGNRILYSVGGHLKELNVKNGRRREIKVHINPDLPQLRPQWKAAIATLQNVAISPTGKRALLTARGDVYTVPVKDGTTRNLTNSDNIREMGALWSPKGDRIAYISDQGGQHSLVLADQTGQGDRSVHKLGDQGYFSLVSWGGDGSRIIYQDNHLSLYAFEVGTGKSVRIHSHKRRGDNEVSQSSDGKWLAFTTPQENYLSDIMLFNFDSGETVKLTDGMSNSAAPAFSPDGKYLYFTSSTNAGPRAVGLDMSTQEKPNRAGIYAVVLAADGKSPLLPKSGDEEVKTDAPEAKKTEDKNEGDKKTDKDKDAKKPETRIDVENLSERIVALPIAERNYGDLSIDHEGALYYLDHPQPGISTELPGAERKATARLMRFDFEDKKAKQVKDKVAGYMLSADGKQVIIRGRGSSLSVGKIGKKIEDKPLKTADVKSYVDPKAEWRHIFDETWRMERDYFYDPNMHGLDWQGIYDRYKPLVSHVGRREDLSALLVEMIGEMQVGHNRVGGGDRHREKPVKVGLLGADIRFENGAYRVAKIYDGEKWNPFLKAPLAAPGIGLGEGDYILAVNGRKIGAQDNFFSFFENTVGKQVTLDVGDKADMTQIRKVVVEPIANEASLRQWSWVENNRKYVADQTDGKVGYIYLPNTAGAGYRYFNRMFYAQVDKQALIIDERRNSGGQAANYITDVLSRTYLSSWKDRDGLLFDTPGGGVYGPKVMLIDQDAGSGGDFLPYSFKYMGLGKLIGKRTWGGLIGIAVNPELIDGGFLVVPFFRYFTPDGEWRIENEGVAPDIDIELESADVNRGVDSQLDRAIAEVLQQLQNFQPVKQKVAPAMPQEVGK